MRGAPRRGAWLLLSCWALVSFVVIGSLMLSHVPALPAPSPSDPALRAAVAAARGEQADGWFALHVLYTRCKCSRQVLEHLFARGPLAGVEERIVLVESAPELELRARAAGYALEVLTTEALPQRYPIAAAPLFIVADARGEIRYAGGYTARKQAAEIHDLAILRALREGERASEFPLFGCAVSRSLARVLDPLGLKDTAPGE